VESIPLKGTAEIVGEPGIGMTLTAEPDVFLKNYPDAEYVNVDGNIDNIRAIKSEA
jgi:hypothetical protein